MFDLQAQRFGEADDAEAGRTYDVLD